ncbi:ABC-2 type transporter [Eubacterium ruminantium]|nr:ABC-2 type transporter [Eubacterium ruminantium]
MVEKKRKLRKTRYRGRIAQIPIYIGKNFRSFVYQNDWKVIPMAAFIAALVSVVVKKSFFVTMEGTAMGSLAVASIGLWNGCFNSIQVVCRERNIVKREHRSGMHISSYIISHMIYQAFLCLLQTLTILIVFIYTNVKLPAHGAIFDIFLVDFGITIFLITYAADMMSLFISSIVKSSTSAMTVMPIVLMIQLVFSGGLFTLPKNLQGYTNFMISNHGIVCISAEADYNNLETHTVWKMVKKIANNSDEESKKMVESLEEKGFAEKINMEAAKANYKKEYKNSNENIRVRWELLMVFSAMFALLAMIVLEFVDKDKR